MFVEVRKQFPEISRWVESVYGTEAHLNHGDSTILSKAGLHQGDPLAGLLFSLGLNPVINKINEIENMLKNAWFLDDGSLGSNKEGLQAAVDIIVQEGPSRGLYLSPENSQVIGAVKVKI